MEGMGDVPPAAAGSCDALLSFSERSERGGRGRYSSSSSANVAAAPPSPRCMRRMLFLVVSLVLLGIQLHFSVSSGTHVTAATYGSDEEATAVVHMLRAGLEEDPSSTPSDVLGNRGNRTRPGQNLDLQRRPSAVPPNGSQPSSSATGGVARTAERRTSAPSLVPHAAPMPNRSRIGSLPRSAAPRVTASVPSNDTVLPWRRVPTCLCPSTCDLSAPHRRACREAIEGLRRATLPQQDMGEIRACREAVQLGSCGAECLPGVCRTLTGSGNSSAAGAEDDGPPVDYVDWSIVEGLDPPSTGPFHRRNGVVVATKVVGPEMLSQTKQMLCLLTAAYNRHVNYDVVVFSTLPWEPHQIRELQAVVPYTKLTVAPEGPTLEQQLSVMTPDERDYLYRRCSVKPGENLTWYHRCAEVPNTTQWAVRLSYAWQAEFRAQRVWNMPELAGYRYMMWVDTDALCSKPWNDDPVRLMVENDLVLLFDNIPGDFATNRELLNKMRRAYNRTICKLTVENGAMRAHPCTGNFFSVSLVHGFFHLSNLDFFRSPTASRFLKILVESQRFSREWDDQLAVTIPPAMEAPHRAWDLRWHGWNLSVFHNGHLDGKGRESPAKDSSYRTFWNHTVRHQWRVAREMCHPLVKHTGR